MRRSTASFSRLRISGLLACLAIAPLAQAIVSQSPLVTGGDIPGSLALVPSVEWPTVLSVANLGSYSSASTYSGYFDSDKCYVYSYANASSQGGTNLDNSWFEPQSAANGHKCTGARQWSGNFLNWPRHLPSIRFAVP